MKINVGAGIFIIKIDKTTIRDERMTKNESVISISNGLVVSYRDPYSILNSIVHAMLNLYITVQ